MPTGRFACVATRPYDQQAYGDITLYAPDRLRPLQRHAIRIGASLQQRHSDIQIFWNVGNTTLVNRDNDDTQSLDAMPSINTFLPGAVPSDFDARNRFLNYKRDPNTPKHQIRWNFVAELPFGRGKKLLGNARGIVEKMVGGWQIAGIGNTRHGYWTLPTNYLSDRQPDRDLRIQVPDPGLPERHLLPGLSLVERLYSRQPDQQRRRQREAERHHGRAGELQAGERAADSVGSDGASGECSGGTRMSPSSGTPTTSGSR